MAENLIERYLTDVGEIHATGALLHGHGAPHRDARCPATDPGRELRERRQRHIFMHGEIEIDKLNNLEEPNVDRKG